MFFISWLHVVIEAPGTRPTLSTKVFSIGMLSINNDSTGDLGWCLHELLNNKQSTKRVCYLIEPNE